MAGQAFFEFYSMAVPLLMPSRDWALRLVFDAEASFVSVFSSELDIAEPLTLNPYTPKPLNAKPLNP